MHPRQSAEDYLSAIREETQQLEEQLASHRLVRQFSEEEKECFSPDCTILLPQKIAQLEQEKGCRTQKAAVFDKSPTAWAGGADLSAVNTPQDYYGGFIGSPCQARGPDGGLIVLPEDAQQLSETCLSNNSDQESGIADLSCRSPVSEDSGRDQDSDEAASSAS